MNDFNDQIYKKSGIAITKLARDILTAQTGARLPSVSEYAQTLGVSRGVIQKAYAYLENHGCIEIEKSHGTGTLLRGIQAKVLCACAGWDSITLNLPVPSTETLASLTTALYQQTQNFPIPLALVYATGSESRVHYLQKNSYDAILVSLESARLYCAKYDFLDAALVLEGSHYGSAFCACFANPAQTQVQDGMRVAIDPLSSDYTRVTKAFCAGKDVIYIETPLIAFFEAVKTNAVDMIVHRQEAFAEEIFAQERGGLRPCFLSAGDFPIADTCTPALLFNKQQNYGMLRFFSKYANLEGICETQQRVLRGELPTRFY